MTRFCESVNGIMLCMKNRVCRCNSEGIASLMSGNERIRMVPSVNSRLPTCAHCKFNGDWSWRLYGLCWRCNALHSCESLVCEERLKWQQSQANAADRDDRVQSVRNRVYSIIYRCSISMQFVGVHLLLLRVNRACKTNTSVTVHHNLDEPLETAVVEQSGLRVVHCSSLTGLAVRLVVRGLLVPRWSALVWLFDSSLLHRWSIAGPSAGLAVPLSLVHRSSVCWCIARPSAGASRVRLLVWLFLCHSCIVRPSARLVAPASLVHRWSFSWSIAGPSAGPSRVPLFLCHSCIARPSGCCSVPRASLMRRSSACLCTARPSADASLVHLLVRLLESRSLLHRWVEGYRTSGRRGCSFGVAGEGIVKACSIESNGGSERKTAC